MLYRKSPHAKTRQKGTQSKDSEFVVQREDGEDVEKLKMCLIRATGAPSQRAAAGWRQRSSGTYQVGARGKHLPARS